MKKIIAKFSGGLLLALLFQWWLLFFSPFNIPKYIPNTPINILGLLILLSILVTLIFLNKRIMQLNKSISVFHLVLIGTFVCFLAETIFQIVRQPTLQVETVGERIKYFLHGVIGVTALSVAISFFVAFQIKTKRTMLLLMFIGIFLALFQLIRPFLMEIGLVVK